MWQLLKYVNDKLNKLANQPAAPSDPGNSEDSASAQLLQQIIAALPANAGSVAGRSNVGVEADGATKPDEEIIRQLLASLKIDL